MIFVPLILVICILCAYARWRRVAKCLNEPPVYPGAWPVVGHIPSALGRENFWTFLRQLAINLPHRGGVTRLFLGPVKVYVVCNPKDCLIIANQCLDKSVYYEFAAPWMGESLLVTKSAVWKKDRKMLMPAFGHHILQGFRDSFNREARRTVESLSAVAGNGSFDHSPYIKAYAIDTLCNTVLGIDISEVRQEYMHMSETLMKGTVERVMNVFLHSNIIYKWTNLKKSEDRYIEYFHSFAEKAIKDKRLELKEKSQKSLGKKRNFLELMIEISENETITNKQMRDHLNLMIVAGFDTISFSMTVILLMIGTYKNVQERIYEEITKVLYESSKDIELLDLDQLVYLEAVIKESIRLHPSGPAVVREIKEDIKLDNCTLYAGNPCVLLLSGLNLHPIWGADAEQFKPERWLDPSTHPDHPAAFATFSIGRRNCIGKYYSMISMKTFLVHIIQNYIIDADCSQIKFSMDVIPRLESGHHISLQKRL